MKKITIRRFGIIHYHAGCNECGFTAGMQTKETPTTADVRREVRKHVLKTGHEVWVESGSQIIYTTKPIEQWEGRKK